MLDRFFYLLKSNYEATCEAPKMRLTLKNILNYKQRKSRRPFTYMEEVLALKAFCSHIEKHKDKAYWDIDWENKDRLFENYFNSLYYLGDTSWRSLFDEYYTDEDLEPFRQLINNDTKQARIGIINSFLLDDFARPLKKIRYGRHRVLDQLYDHNDARKLRTTTEEVIWRRATKDSLDNPYYQYDMHPALHIDAMRTHDEKDNIIFQILYFFLITHFIIDALDGPTSLLATVFFSWSFIFIILVAITMVYLEYGIGVFITKLMYFEPEDQESPEFDEFFNYYEMTNTYIYLYILNFLDIKGKYYLRLVSGLQALSIKQPLPYFRSQLCSIIIILLNKTKNFYLSSSLHYAFTSFLGFIFFIYYSLHYIFYYIIGSIHTDFYLAYFLAPSKFIYVKNLLNDIFMPTILHFLDMLECSDVIKYFFLEAAPASYFLELFFILLSLVGLFYAKLAQRKVLSTAAYVDLKCRLDLRLDSASSSAIHTYVHYYLNGVLLVKVFRLTLVTYFFLMVFYTRTYWNFFFYGAVYGRYVIFDDEEGSTDSILYSVEDFFFYLQSTAKSLSSKADEYAESLMVDEFFEFAATGGLDGNVAFTFFILKSCLLVVGFFVLVIYYQYYYYLLLFSDQNQYLSVINTISNITTREVTYSYVALPRPELLFALIFTIALCIFSISSTSLLVVIMCIECLTMVTCFTITSSETIQSTDAAIKYFLLSAISACLMLYASSLLYGSIGTLEFIRVTQVISFYIDYDYYFLIFSSFILFLISFFIKLSLYPFMYWVLDIYSVCNMPTLFFISIFSKFFFLFLFYKFFLLFGFAALSGHLVNIILFFSIISILIGSCAIATETNLRKFIALSSIINFGYLILLFTLIPTGMALETSIVYLVNYLLSNIVFFSVVSKFSAFYKLYHIKDLAKIQLDPLHAIVVAISVLSLAGIPPFLGFFSKVFIFNTIMATNYGFCFAILMLLISVPSYFGYFKLLRGLFYIDQSGGNLVLNQYVSEDEVVIYNRLNKWYILDNFTTTPYITIFSNLLKGKFEYQSFSTLNWPKNIYNYKTFNWITVMLLNITYILVSFILLFGHVSSSFIATHTFILCKSNTSNLHNLDLYKPMDAFTLIDFFKDCLASFFIFLLEEIDLFFLVVTVPACSIIGFMLYFIYDYFARNVAFRGYYDLLYTQVPYTAEDFRTRSKPFILYIKKEANDVLILFKKYFNL